MKYKYLILILSSLFVISCSSTKQVYNDDAVRIKIDSVQNLEKFNPYIEPNTGVQRNPSTLRGNVFNITRFVNEAGEPKEYVTFLDSLAFKLADPQYEYIPIEFIDLQGPKLGVGRNWFENYNNPLDNDVIREVDTLETEGNGCGCGKLVCPECNLTCVFPWQERANNRSVIFGEINAGIASYESKNTVSNQEKGFDVFFQEYSAGYRFGDITKAHFGLGLSYFSGVDAFQVDGSLLTRDALMLYGKYTFDEWNCVFPYVYGQIGAAIDVNSLYMGKLALANKMKVWFNYDCDCDANLSADAKLRQKLAYESPNVDLDIPIALGIGTGIEFPVMQYFDLSIDLGYKYIKSGESTTLYDFKVPVAKPLSIYTLRIGIHY